MDSSIYADYFYTSPSEFSCEADSEYDYVPSFPLRSATFTDSSSSPSPSCYSASISSTSFYSGGGTTHSDSGSPYCLESELDWPGISHDMPPLPFEQPSSSGFLGGPTLYATRRPGELPVTDHPYETAESYSRPEPATVFLREGQLSQSPHSTDIRHEGSDSDDRKPITPRRSGSLSSTDLTEEKPHYLDTRVVIKRSRSQYPLQWTESRGERPDRNNSDLGTHFTRKRSRSPSPLRRTDSKGRRDQASHPESPSTVAEVKSAAALRRRGFQDDCSQDQGPHSDLTTSVNRISPPPIQPPRKRLRVSGPNPAPGPARTPSRQVHQAHRSLKTRKPPPPRNLQSEEENIDHYVENVKDFHFICPLSGCSWHQENHRLPDFKRHIRTHRRKPEFVCKGVLAEHAADYGLTSSAGYEISGQWRVGGCLRTFSRADALKRHFRSRNVQCIHE